MWGGTRNLWVLNWRYRSQCPRGLGRRSSAARLLGMWVRIQPGAWMHVCFECFVLSGRGACDELITRPEESYRLWCVVVWSRNVVNERPWPTVGGGLSRQKQTKNLAVHKLFADQYGTWNCQQQTIITLTSHCRTTCYHQSCFIRQSLWISSVVWLQPHDRTDSERRF